MLMNLLHQYGMKVLMFAVGISKFCDCKIDVSDCSFSVFCPGYVTAKIDVKD